MKATFAALGLTEMPQRGRYCSEETLPSWQFRVTGALLRN